MVANHESFVGTVLVVSVTSKTVDRAGIKEWSEIQWCALGSTYAIT